MKYKKKKSKNHKNITTPEDRSGNSFLENISEKPSAIILFVIVGNCLNPFIQYMISRFNNYVITITLEINLGIGLSLAIFGALVILFFKPPSRKLVEIIIVEKENSANQIPFPIKVLFYIVMNIIWNIISFMLFLKKII
jgi:membrane associated rhomboid family serine protease